MKFRQKYSLFETACVVVVFIFVVVLIVQIDIVVGVKLNENKSINLIKLCVTFSGMRLKSVRLAFL